MLSYIAALLLLVAGTGVGILNLRSASRFEDFCTRMAAMRGEQNELAADRAKNDEGYGHYRKRIRRELVRSSENDFFPHEILSEAAELGHYLVITDQATVAFIIALAVFGLYVSS